MTNEHKRALILGSAGLLLGATVYGWFDHTNKKNADTAATQNKQLAVVPQPIAPAQTQLTPPAQQQQATAQPSPLAQQASVVPASKREEVQLLARSEAGRQDPMAPTTVAAAQPTYRPQPRAQYSRTSELAPPPPPIAYGDNSGLQPPPSYGFVQPLPEKPRKIEPLAKAVQLVGILDDKAVFSVADDVAEANNVMRTFTLGRGQKYGGLSIKSVQGSSVTVTDGTHVCTKQLDSIH